MQTLSIIAIPNQSLSARLSNLRFDIRIKEANGVMVADIDIEGVRILSATRILAGEPIIPYRHMQEGNFILLTADDELPDWRQFSISQELVYLTVEEIA